MQLEFISIHAPTRGATVIRYLALFPFPFQSTLPRGERPSGMRGGNRSSINFNPRSHEGSDHSAVSVSAADPHFNPRSHEGSDNFSWSVKDLNQNFNPRSHEGSDPALLLPYRFSDHFNPRSHEGSDVIRCGRMRGFVISIHAPTRGATN